MSSIESVLPPVTSGILTPPYQPTTIGILALISILAFEQMAVATVMPVVAAALDGTALYAAAFGVAMAAGIVGMVLAGRWSDRAGPAPPLWAGIAAFVLGLVGAGVATNMPVLVLGRALQGFGGGLVSVALYVVVGQHYPASLHARIFAAFAGAWVVPSIVGPALAGVMARQLGWRWVFLSAALMAVPAALLVRRGLARTRGLAAASRQARASEGWPRRRQGADIQGASIVAAASAGLLYAAAEPSSLRALVVVVALVGLAMSAPRLLPAGTLRGGPGLPAVIALRGLAAAAFFAAEVFIPLMLTNERGLLPVQAGLVLTVGALGWSAGSWFQGRDSAGRDEQACVRTLRVGLAAIAAGTMVVSLVLLPQVPVVVAALGWAVTGVGMGLVYPTLSVLTLRFAPAAEQGSASSALQLSDSLFSAVGLALAGMLVASLQAGSPRLAYFSGFAAAAALAGIGVVLAVRARHV